MKTSITNLTIVATLGALLVTSNAMAIGPGSLGSKTNRSGQGFKKSGPSKSLSINGGHISIHNSGKHVDIHGSGKHLVINKSFDSYSHGHCSGSTVVYAPPVVNYTPSYVEPCHREVVYSAPTTVVNYQPETPVYEEPEYVTPGLQPVNSAYVVEPGDSFYEVSLKMYRTSDAAEGIAMFNRMPLDAGLRPGMLLHIPSISADGELSPANAPPAGVQ